MDYDNLIRMSFEDVSAVRIGERRPRVKQTMIRLPANPLRFKMTTVRKNPGPEGQVSAAPAARAAATPLNPDLAQRTRASASNETGALHLTCVRMNPRKVIDKRTYFYQ
jgi:hypothetical protein